MARLKKDYGRSTVYNNITSPEKMEQVLPENIRMENDFLDYLISTDRAPGTIKQYRANLHVFWIWNLELNGNKFFVDLKKRDISRFQSYCIQTWGWSPKRVRTVKATLSSMSNYIENILDDEYEGYKPIIRKIESPANNPVRKKTVFKQEDLQYLLNKLVEHELYMKACMLSLAMNSGRRKQELLQLKLSYFTDENTVCKGAFYKTPEKIKTKGRGSQGKMLDVYTLKKPFDHYLNLWVREREKLGIKSDWLFPRKDHNKWLDQPMTVAQMDSWAESFTNLMEKKFYWHAIRHRFVTYLIENGIPDSVVQDIIGWQSADMIRIYDDSSSESKFEQYFDEDGIKQAETKTLSDL